MSTSVVKAHASLGASSASRWWACPGSVRLIEAVGESYESDAAAEGTLAHSVAEIALRENRSPFDAVGESGVTAEMAEHVSVFVDYCRARMVGPHGIEQQFTLDALHPPAPMFGTADFWAWDGAGTLEIVDLKYGMGVVVEVLDNKQLLYYALGATLATGVVPDTIIVTIVQPRASHPDGRIRSFEIDLLELAAFANELLEHARATTVPDAPRIPGAWCRWCPASGRCPEQHTAALAVAQMEFGVDRPPDPASLPEAVLFEMLPKAHLLADFLKSIQQRGEALMKAGVDIPGMKLVARRGRRAWADETDLIAWLTEHGYGPEQTHDAKLKSVAQLEKIVGRDVLPAEAIAYIETGFKMIPDTDSTPGVTLDAGFDVLTAGPSPED